MNHGAGGRVPKVVFTPQLERFLSVPPTEARGRTEREVLEAVFAENRRLQGYILDDQGHLRQHVAVFVNGERITDPAGLSDPVTDASEVFVMQALSGG